MRPAMLFLCLVLLGLCVPALAADSSQSPPFPGAGIGALVMWYVCASRKQQEIGGWLLYYHIQLYLGVSVSVVVLALNHSAYLPSTWAAVPELYPWFLLSAVPGVLVLLAQLVVAEILRMTRNETWLRWLRWVLWFDLVSTCLAGAIDLKYFEDNVFLDGFSLAWTMVWLPYFYFSRRVKRVYCLKDWLAPVAAPTTQPAA